MLTFRSVLFFLAAASSTFVLAQTTQDEQATMISECMESTRISSDFKTQVTYSTTDDTHYQNATWTYDPVACTKITVPITRISTTNDNTGERYSCSSPAAYDASGFVHSQCSITLGAIARAAAEGDADCESCKSLNVE